MHDVPEHLVALAPDYDFVDLPRLVADGGGACLALKGLRVGIALRVAAHFGQKPGGPVCLPLRAGSQKCRGRGVG